MEHSQTFHEPFPYEPFVEDAKGFFSAKSNGKIRLVDQQNYTYAIDRTESIAKFFWNCERAYNQWPLLFGPCKAQAVTFGNKIIKLNGRHYHEPTYHDDNKLDLFLEKDEE